MLGKYRQFHSNRTSVPASLPHPNAPTYPGQPQDITCALTWLSRASSYRLPDEILKLVLFYADYDCIRFTAYANHGDKRHSYGPETTAIPYAETKPLKYLGEGERGRIRKVVLKTKGRDQAFTTVKNTESWSWFEVGRTKALHTTHLEGGGDKTRRGPEWARNSVASKELQEHEFVYNMDRPEETGDEMREWIESLENGHRVSIVPMARYQRWECWVEEGSVDIEVEIWR